MRRWLLPLGLSGLLVKSAQMMVVTADDMQRAGVTAPILVGGAALSKNFTLTKIAPAYNAPVFYAKDAMAGTTVMMGAREKRKLSALGGTKSSFQIIFRASAAG